MPNQEAEVLVQQMHQSSGVTSEQLIDLKTTPRPNIVFLILESWQYDIANPQSEYMPFFSTLCKQGVFFSQFYANGSHSDQGVACIFSGFPTLSSVSLPRSQDKYEIAPSVLKPFRKNAYDSYFQYGGQLYFGGIQSYIYHLGFDKVFDVKDFDKRIPQGSVGVHDEDNLRVFADQIKTLRQPFFTACYTLSTHAPYDFPGPRRYQNMAESNYVNGMHYADMAVRKFFERVQKEDWFKNTLFIFVPDHGHPTYLHSTYRSFGICRLPMLWVGPVLKQKYAGREVDRLCSQIDISKTLLHQMGYDARDFIWSKDIFDAGSQEFALRTVDDGFGFKTKQGEYYYNIDDKDDYYNTFPKALQDSMHRLGRAYMQVHVQKFSNQ
jgi:phosphoglycerol transferase MdoB-like AlkP superfamily enzyme